MHALTFWVAIFPKCIEHSTDLAIQLGNMLHIIYPIFDDMRVVTIALYLREWIPSEALCGLNVLYHALSAFWIAVFL